MDSESYSFMPVSILGDVKARQARHALSIFLAFNLIMLNSSLCIQIYSRLRPNDDGAKCAA